MTPACFGSYVASASAPCGRCAQRGPCAARVDCDGFGILLTPRFPQRDAIPHVLLNTSPAEEMNRLFTLVTAKGLTVTVKGEWVNYRTKRVAKVTPHVSGGIQAVFPLLPVERLAEFGGDVSITAFYATKAARKGPPPRTVAEMRRQRQLYTQGSTAVGLTAETMSTLILAVASALYGDSRE